jgi:response regulator NasT
MNKAQDDQIRVLLVDDEPLIRMDLKEMLEEALVYKVVAEAKDGNEAVAAALEYTPDIIFMDIRMPNCDGIEAAKQIQAKAKYKIPIIMLTAYSQADLYEEASKHGVYAYLTKPIRRADLGPNIEIAMKRALEMQGLEKELKKLTDRLETRKLVEKAKGLLMKNFNLNEDEAYRKIQKEAMNKRLSNREVAQAVLDTFNDDQKKSIA